MIEIRNEEPGDEAAIRLVNDLAFERNEESTVVDALRRSDCGLISLVATLDGAVVGHILFSPVALEHEIGGMTGMGLAPMSVRPELQRKGIGSQLVRAGLDMVRVKSYPFVMVLGHPDYYPRFGFVPASRHGIRCQWDEVPDDAFMVIVFDDAAIRGVSGIARYRSEFDAAV